jgi:hypothetical protein
MKKKIPKFEVSKIGLQFTCTHGVYANHNSICYCTDALRANVISHALNKTFPSRKKLVRFVERYEKKIKKRSD